MARGSLQAEIWEPLSSSAIRHHVVDASREPVLSQSSDSHFFVIGNGECQVGMLGQLEMVCEQLSILTQQLEFDAAKDLCS
jgi:hypothetical protein